MNAEFFNAVEDIEKEKGIPRGYMYEKIEQALLAAFRKDNPDFGENVEVVCDEEKKRIEVLVHKTVVESVEDPTAEIDLDAARKISKRCVLGDDIAIPVETRQFGRIAAQAAKQVIIQGIREAERGLVYDAFNSRQHEMLTGVVNRIDPRTGSADIKISSQSEFADALLPAGEQIPGEALREGDRIRVYVTDVRRTPRGPQVLVSRTHPGLVRRLFETEVPEVFDGVVEIKGIAREAGSRTKLSVVSNDEAVDAVGACVGPRGSRINEIVRELGGEKIEVVNYSEDPELYIAAALAPATVISTSMEPDGKTCRVVVPDGQLSLAIGREGQNARLAAKLTGCKIDIKSDLAT